MIKKLIFALICLAIVLPNIAWSRHPVVVAHPHYGCALRPYTYGYPYPGVYGWGGRGYYPPGPYISGFYFYSYPGITYKKSPKLPWEWRYKLAEERREKIRKKRESARAYIAKVGSINIP